MVHHIDQYVGKKLREYRTAKGWSQKELASRLDISFQQLQKYEHAVNRISCSRLYEIAAILAAPLSYFFPDFDQSVSMGKTLPTQTAVYNEDHVSNSVKVAYTSKDGSSRSIANAQSVAATGTHASLQPANTNETYNQNLEDSGACYKSAYGINTSSSSTKISIDSIKVSEEDLQRNGTFAEETGSDDGLYDIDLSFDEDEDGSLTPLGIMQLSRRIASIKSDRVRRQVLYLIEACAKAGK